MKPDLVVIFVCILASGVHADAAVLAPNRAIYTRNLKSSDPECSMHVATGFWYVRWWGASRQIDNHRHSYCRRLIISSCMPGTSMEGYSAS